MGSVIIDANLLLLLVVGGASRSYIRAHKRLKAFTTGDFDLLTDYMQSRFTRIVILPNVVTEVSNLAAYIGEPAKRHIRHKLAEFVERSDERYVESAKVVAHGSFLDLGLTDTAILLAVKTESGATILTADLDLAVAGEMAGLRVVNFNHLRD